MPFRWYRSRLFLFGLAGLVVLLSGWFAFPRTAIQISFGTDLGRFAMMKEDGAVGFSYQHPSCSLLIPTDGFELTHYEQFSGYSIRLFAPAFGFFGISGWYGARIGIWTMVLAYSLTWLGVLRWWLRRKYRLMTSAVKFVGI
ncbi:MAG: hypothetical protein EOP88_20090 [Verrucomicrobiaceae bacterium]|nr:MAG: hypothetical protein EOP88_20090 [Verrucomicrobiaceae bacterium]